MKKIYLYAKRQKKLIARTLAILAVGFVALMFYTHFDYENNFWMYHDTEIIRMLKSTAIYVLIGAVLIITELYYPNLKTKWKQYKERKRNHSVQGRWYESPMNSFFVTLCWIWLINNAGKVITTLWMASLYSGYDVGLMLNALMGIGMCIILWGIIKGNGKAFGFFIFLQLLNGTIRSEIERDGTHILISVLLCGIMSLLLLLKNRDGKNGYEVLYGDKIQEMSNNSTPYNKHIEEVHTQSSNNSMSPICLNDEQYDKECHILVAKNKEKDVKPLYCDCCGKLIDNDSVYCTYCGKKINKGI